ncbi:hypothetical protein SAMN05446635_1084 [Burkholderia sp. OK233]|nr:hypothetical protein SAMN05446635_1084 [Burkholderia sp. OK233]
MGEASVVEALDAARVQLTHDAVFASLAARTAGSARAAPSATAQSA